MVIQQCNLHEATQRSGSTEQEEFRKIGSFIANLMDEDDPIIASSSGVSPLIWPDKR